MSWNSKDWTKLIAEILRIVAAAISGGIAGSF